MHPGCSILNSSLRERLLGRNARARYPHAAPIAMIMLFKPPAEHSSPGIPSVWLRSNASRNSYPGISIGVHGYMSNF
eukprot:2864935-Rhodomonas_salina.1